ncbi:unnamed protein product [Absidia cylindrospora]
MMIVLSARIRHHGHPDKPTTTTASEVCDKATTTWESTSTNSTGSTTTPPSTLGLNSKKSLEWLIGRRIKVKTTLDEEFEGLIYTYDRITNCIALDILFDEMKN